MKKTATRISAIALSLALAVPMVVPAMAADGENWIVASLDGSPIYNESYPDGMQISDIMLVDDLGVGVGVQVSVNGEAVSTSRPVNATGTLTDGTVYRLYEDGDRSLSLSTTNRTLEDDINIEITRTPIEYTVEANSGHEGFKDDMGSDSSPTCEVSVSGDTVGGNESYTVAFTPYEGLVIKALNIRTSEGARNLVDINAGTVTVGDTELTVSKNGGVVTVKADHVANDLFITALTADLAGQYQLSVVTVGDVTTDVVSKYMSEGEVESVVLTPVNGILDSIQIKDGGQTGSVSTGQTSVTVNGHAYRITWGANGKATVAVPAITADVTITAVSESGRAGLSINVPGNINCNYDPYSYPQVGSPVIVRLEPNDYAEIVSVTIKSATSQAMLAGDEYRFTLDGRTYRVDTLYNGTRIIYFDAFPGNIEIDVESRESRHTIELQHDENSDYEGRDSDFVVYDGDALDVAFEALNEGEDIQRLVFTVNGQKITADRDDDHVTIDGTRQHLVWLDGRVEVLLSNVSSSMTIKSYTTDYEEDYRVTIGHDGGAIASSNNLYANRGETKAVNFTERNNYTIEAIVVTVDGRTYVAERGDRFITINGSNCALFWSSVNASITLNNIRSDMEVYCETDYDSSNNSDGDYRITACPDSGATTRSEYVYADRGDSKTISFTERSGYTIERISVTVDGEVYTAERGDSHLTVDGRRCDITWGSSKSSITLSNIRDDMEVSCETAYIESSNPVSGDHFITLMNDRGSYYEGSGELWVDKGDDREIVFYAEDGCRLQRLEIECGGKTSRVNYDGSSITVDGIRCPVDWDGRNSVAVNLRDIRADVTVRVVSNEEAWSKTLTRRANSGTYINLSTNSNTVGAGSPVTVTVSPAAGYQVERVEFRLDSSGKYAVVNSRDASFILDGQTYQVSRSADGTLQVRFEMLPANMTVTSYGVLQTVTTPSAPPVTSGITHTAYITGVGNNQFAPERTVTRAEALTMLLRATQSIDSNATSGMVAPPYLDVNPGTWYYDYVTIAYNRGYLNMLNGTSWVIFNPNEPITRAQFVEMAGRVFGMVPTVPVPTAFPDVLAGYWASSYIVQATGAGWINGYPDGLFYPEDTLTRCQLVAIINRATDRSADASYINSHIGQVTTFSDIGPSHWAYYEILEAANTHTFNMNSGSEVWVG